MVGWQLQKRFVKGDHTNFNSAPSVGKQRQHPICYSVARWSERQPSTINCSSYGIISPRQSQRPSRCHYRMQLRNGKLPAKMTQSLTMNPSLPHKQRLDGGNSFAATLPRKYLRAFPNTSRRTVTGTTSELPKKNV